MRVKFLLSLVCATIFGNALQAQVAPSAVGGDTHLWVGGEYSNFDPNWGLIRLPGIAVLADLSLSRRYGLEGEARFLDFTKPDGLTEESYLGGPYGTLYRRGKLSFNAKFLLGGGLINYTGGIGYGSYFAFTPGATLEYRFAHRFKARADYEYQFMPSAPGLPGVPDNGLHPNGFGAGIVYRVF